MAAKETVDRARALRERVEQDYADAWDFKEITTLVGIVESYASVTTENGPRVVCTLQEVEGAAPKRYAVWLSQAALLARFEDLQPAIGELVAIHYLGVSEHAERGKSPAHRFRVEVDRPGSTFNWGIRAADVTTFRDARGDRAGALEGEGPAPGSTPGAPDVLVSDDALETALANDVDSIPF